VFSAAVPHDPHFGWAPDENTQNTARLIIEFIQKPTFEKTGFQIPAFPKNRFSDFCKKCN
jgi:hypothetical protein